MSIREAKGRQIAEKANIRRHGQLWVVPSESGKGKYTVDAKVSRCTCPDWDFRQPCKHIFAVQIVIEREQTTVTETHADGSTTTTTTEAVKVTRKTYKQEWPAYNAAQTREKAVFRYLLQQLCQGVGEPGQTNGRPRYPLEDMIFAMCYKVYSTVSGRRFMTDLGDAHARGYLSALPSYNTIFRYFESEVLTDYLKMLIEESSLPLQAIEEDFAVDSTGISTCRFVRWFQAKYGWDFEKGAMNIEGQTVEKKDWIKVHLMTGVKTNIVTSVEISDRNSHDTNYFKPLVDATANNFAMRQVSADKAYLSLNNLRLVTEHQAMPHIPFMSNSRPNHSGDKTGLWRQMYHYFSYNHERFAKNYHKRSNVETTFMMIKAKFGDALRSKTRTAQINEALCKVLCHNICCLIQSMYELGLKPKFWADVAA